MRFSCDNLDLKIKIFDYKQRLLVARLRYLSKSFYVWVKPFISFDYKIDWPVPSWQAILSTDQANTFFNQMLPTTLQYKINEHARSNTLIPFSILLVLIGSCSPIFSKFSLAVCQNSFLLAKIKIFLKKI